MSSIDRAARERELVWDSVLKQEKWSRYTPSLERRRTEGSVNFVGFQSRLVRFSQPRLAQISLVTVTIASIITTTIISGLFRGRRFVVTALCRILPVAAVRFRRFAIFWNTLFRFGVPLPS